MNRRTHESPMDFEWQDSSGPADPTSPFHQLTQRHGQMKGFETPSRLPAPPSTSSFARGTTFKTATPFRNPSFTTPRKPFDADIFSETSGAESSPAENADSEATPDALAPKIIAFTANKISKPVFGKYGLTWSNLSPASGGRAKPIRHMETAAHKARKRKRIDREHSSTTRRDSHDSASDSDRTSRPRSRQEKESMLQPEKESWFGSMLTSLEKRRDLPYVLSHYPQIMFNYFLLGLVCWALWGFAMTISRDIAGKEQEAVDRALTEITKCATDYNNNRCAPHMRVPAMEIQCSGWAACMERDPKIVAKSALGAQTVGQILNSFMDTMSYKTMLFIALLFGIALGVSNAMGGSARLAAQQQHYAAPPPPTPWYASPGPMSPHPHQLEQWGHPTQTPWGLPPSTPSRRKLETEERQFQIMPSAVPARDGRERERERSPRKVSRH